MSQPIATETINNAVTAFSLAGSPRDVRPYGNGHINDTYLVTCGNAGEEKKYILQRMNHSIFQNPQALMENIANVTAFLQKSISEKGGDPERETLCVIRTKNGENYFEDSFHNFWRVFPFIEGTFCLEKVENAGDFYDCATAFGSFQRLLADYPAETLHETIPLFHHTPARFRTFQEAVAKDPLGRAESVQAEIDFALAREADTHVLTDLLEKGELPLRVTHNDTKLNNILFDAATKKALCIIDLDTVMPGLSLYDFGDAIRTGANTGAEDETDLSKIGLDLSLFETFTEGFLKGCAGSLTPLEIKLLPMGAKLMTYECGIRFLADYLVGDIYFKIHRETHNLDRARTQFKLVADMEKKWPEMEEIVTRLS
ncbi:MAG: aminoglycoside phosphotransferase family protein [Lachnospiraceae bacterium]|nr:aminoglycoside phosphotransferase family protein [Lachnospiraceae bacterium]